MKRMIMICAMLLGLSSWALAQGTGEVWGRVVDKTTGVTLPNANVYINTGSTIIGIQADLDGAFKLKGIPAGTYTINFSYTGYGHCSLKQVVIFADGIQRVGDIALQPGVELTEAVIFARPVIGVDAVPRIVAKDLEALPGKTDVSLIVSTITPGVQRNENGELYFRGARSNDFVYYVDGVKVSAENMKVPSTAYGSVEVYTGGVPARYGDFTGGCVVIETQSYTNWANSR